MQYIANFVNNLCFSLFASKRLAELLIEKAWSEVKYSKIYAKLCEYLGKCDKLNFDQADQSVPGDKKKNVTATLKFRWR